MNTIKSDNSTTTRSIDLTLKNRFKLRRFSYLLTSTVIAFSLAACSSTESDNQVKQAKHRAEAEAEKIMMTAQRAEAQGKLHSRQRHESQLFAMADLSEATSPGYYPPQVPAPGNPAYTENYQHEEENQVFTTSNNPVSTFSIDVDTGSYSNARRMLNQGWLPPADAVRIEEFINYFDYQYPVAEESSHPFVIDTQVSNSPWNQGRMLMRIGLKAHALNDKSEKQLEASNKNLVFLLDVSGSMNSANKLPLVKRALMMLTNQLTENDSVAIVVYAGASGVVLEPTKANQSVKIEQALNRLSAGGSTNGGEGIELAYKLAKQAFKENGVNRVILATDGDFNVGRVNHQQLIELVEKQKEQGIELTTLGFGQGNYNDHLMEQLADKGNGNYAYIDTLLEARKVLVEELDATLQSVARDVKIQVEFNPNTVAEYRLIGYENRRLNKEDFNNDKVDAGEIGAGHTVTAFYEIVLQDGAKFNDDLRYQQTHKNAAASLNNELAHVKLRYKPMDNDTSILIDQVIEKQNVTDFDAQSMDFKFATSVVGFAQLLKNSKYTQNLDFEKVIELANNNKGKDDYGYRAEFVSLVRMAKTLQSETSRSVATQEQKQN
ncbi:VWA domain-containing protein [Aliiglaciecola sp. 2_MG-2023]|uniref:vWA domain-containing protein n=1 Tax=unclassified Aliiglaciecola TaxID=2593648 RepID=UPI0026E2DF74|nr:MULTISPECIES: VWA domain-containing protein [unclassified Aliiglaciecola]MDO6711779.1 VWA domain-containing protein [Aliiglaciecola sp. 2_MG-2023]MDO6753047.1 VWA domain-containing protein [Aliiglaciecola sp. 1_MG-2023]